MWLTKLTIKKRTIKTKVDKKLWNEAVKAVCADIRKYDAFQIMKNGIIWQNKFNNVNHIVMSKSKGNYHFLKDSKGLAI